MADRVIFVIIKRSVTLLLFFAHTVVSAGENGCIGVAHLYGREFPEVDELKGKLEYVINTESGEGTLSYGVAINKRTEVHFDCDKHKSIGVEVVTAVGRELTLERAILGKTGTEQVLLGGASGSTYQFIYGYLSEKYFVDKLSFIDGSGRLLPGAPDRLRDYLNGIQLPEKRRDVRTLFKVLYELYSAVERDKYVVPESVTSVDMLPKKETVRLDVLRKMRTLLTKPQAEWGVSVAQYVLSHGRSKRLIPYPFERAPQIIDYFEIGDDAGLDPAEATLIKTYKHEFDSLEEILADESYMNQLFESKELFPMLYSTNMTRRDAEVHRIAEIRAGLSAFNLTALASETGLWVDFNEALSHLAEVVGKCVNNSSGR